jgi:hypothetical protein
VQTHHSLRFWLGLWVFRQEAWTILLVSDLKTYTNCPQLVYDPYCWVNWTVTQLLLLMDLYYSFILLIKILNCLFPGKEVNSLSFPLPLQWEEETSRDSLVKSSFNGRIEVVLYKAIQKIRETLWGEGVATVPLNNTQTCLSNLKKIINAIQIHDKYVIDNPNIHPILKMDWQFSKWIDNLQNGLTIFKMNWQSNPNSNISQLVLEKKIMHSKY